MSEKKVVRYTDALSVAVGHSALVVSVDHPDFPIDLKGEPQVLRTTEVQKINENGFETLNTVYVKVQQLNG